MVKLALSSQAKQVKQDKHVLFFSDGHLQLQHEGHRPRHFGTDMGWLHIRRARRHGRCQAAGREDFLFNTWLNSLESRFSSN